MNSAQKVGVAAIATLALGVVLVVASDDVVRESPIESKVGWREDGTKVYLVPVELKDGTTSYKEASDAPCKRRPKGVDGRLCQRVSRDIQGKPRVDPAPELARFAASDMLGDGCESVACSVMAGEDAEAEEKRPTVRK